jgi:predicted nucleic acid-binding protein
VTVVDASVAVDALVAVGPPGELAREELRRQTVLEVPAIFAAEVTSALLDPTPRIASSAADEAPQGVQLVRAERQGDPAIEQRARAHADSKQQRLARRAGGTQKRIELGS